MLTLIFRVTTGIATALIESGRENALDIGNSKIMNSFNTYNSELRLIAIRHPNRKDIATTASYRKDTRHRWTPADKKAEKAADHRKSKRILQSRQDETDRQAIERGEDDGMMVHSD
jgi:hypothetical protein